MSTGWNGAAQGNIDCDIINLLGNEYWLERAKTSDTTKTHYKPTGK